MASDRDKELDDFREQLKLKPTDELVQIALTANDDEDNPGWDAIRVLHHQATREVFEMSRTLCESDNPTKRSIGVSILAQLGIPSRIYLEETLEIFFTLLDKEQDAAVLSAVAFGLGHISHEPRKVKPLLKLKNHPDADVRCGVAFGLSCEEDPLAIAALIELSSDEDDDTRDWATFGLGSQIDVDTAEIREALFARASDFDDKSDAPGEAISGLARRHDQRAFELILNFLEAGDAGTLIFEAAESLADPRLYPALMKLRDHPGYKDYERNQLESAIAACKGQE